MSSKEERSQFHKTIREVFAGKLETTMTTVNNSDTGEAESRIAIKWAQRDSKRTARGKPSLHPQCPQDAQPLKGRETDLQPLYTSQCRRQIEIHMMPFHS